MSKINVIGAHDDLQKATKNAYAQVRQLGMNSRIGPVSYDVSSGDQSEFRVKPYSKNMARLIDEVRASLWFLYITPTFTIDKSYTILFWSVTLTVLDKDFC